MSTYTGSSISSLNVLTPTAGTGQVKELDDAIRQIKRFFRESGTGTLVDLMYPIGSKYESFTSDSPSVDIQTRHGLSVPFGTWVKLSGVVIVGHKDGDSDFGTVNLPVVSNEDPDGGSKTHTLTKAQLPAEPLKTYDHGLSNTGSQGSPVSLGAIGSNSGETNDNEGIMYERDSENLGDGEAHNNLQPYRVMYTWARIA